MAIRANRNLSDLLRQRRARVSATDERLAKMLRITVPYLKHLLRGGRPVYLSRRLAQDFILFLSLDDIAPIDFWGMVADQNARVKRYTAHIKSAKGKHPAKKTAKGLGHSHGQTQSRRMEPPPAKRLKNPASKTSHAQKEI